MTTDSAKGQTVLVTGASGALGSTVVQLAVERGYSVVAVARPGAVFPDLDDPYTIIEGDLTERRFCRQITEGVDIVIHTAAVNDPSRPFEELEPINVEAVRWLYEAADDHGARRFVQISTASLYEHKRGVIEEDGDFEIGSSFTQTKEEAERYLQSRRRDELAWTILRPSLVYGPRGRSFGAAILLIPPLLRLFTPLLPSLTGGPRTNWVHVEDLARAALFVVEHEEAAGEVFNVADDTPLSQGEILSAAIQAYGLSIGPTFPFPSGLLGNVTGLINTDIVFKVLSNLTGPLWKRVEQRFELTGDLQLQTDRAVLLYLNGDKVIGTDKLKALGWEPQWPDLRLGLAETVRWYQAQQWLPDYQGLPEDDEESVIKLIGLRFKEKLVGVIEMADAAPEATVEFEGTWPNLRQLITLQQANLEGTIQLDDIASEQPLVGTMEIQPTSLKMSYQFSFDGDDGESYRFVGEKRLSILSIVGDFTRLEGRVIDTRGDEVGSGTLSMDVVNGVRNTLLSIRLL